MSIQHRYKHVEEAVAKLADVIAIDSNDPWHGASVPPLENIPDPDLWYMTVRQLGIKEKIGSIYVPDSVKDSQGWTQGMAVVVKVGPCCFKGRKYEDLGVTPEMAPKAGDIILFKASSVPTRYRVNDVELMIIPDDAFHSRATPDQCAHLSFKL